MSQQELAQLVHLGEALPPQGAPPTLEEVGDPTTRLVRPQVIELFAQDVRLEQAPVGSEELLELAPLGAAHVADRCLNHTIGEIESVYDVHDYFGLFTDSNAASMSDEPLEVA